MKYTLIWELLNEVESFENEPEQNGDLSLAAFTGWLVNRQVNLPRDATQTLHREPPESIISRFVFFLQRYALMYVRQVLADTPLTTFDDFAYLATLASNPGLTKIELIERNIHGKTTGMEIIRRLVSTGLVEQAEHTIDKRSKLLTVTSQGHQLLAKTRVLMKQVASVVVGDLTEAEQLQLMHLLNKLHTYHYPVYQQGSKAIDQVLKQSSAKKSEP
ncbi:hypothetical protein DYU11_31090 [Fibrisoma montanum]|uniref:HTH marR-type domain-containing protein n=1 Tax=Fibrisoma montanum TaxID=2305895 RepID=A0A418LWT8_9BACT|nr:winged helix DNA-binding protein [Fibrisoma montanum]RIV17691.1 hypothetical protein DYU11_31090 [Fibrisoma montanum]